MEFHLDHDCRLLKIAACRVLVVIDKIHLEEYGAEQWCVKYVRKRGL